MIRLSFLSQVHSYFTGCIMRANRSLMLTVFSLCVTPMALKLIDMSTESVAGSSGSSVNPDTRFLLIAPQFSAAGKHE